MGIPTKKTTETLASILADLRIGMPLDQAAVRAGVRPATVRKWMAEDENLMLQIEKSMADCEYADVKVFDDAVKGEDKKLAVSVAQWRRERLNPTVWGRASRNDSYTRDQQVRELAEELRREGLAITDEQLFKELKQIEIKALPNGKN